MSLKTAFFKYSGMHGRVKAISQIVVGSILTIAGIVLAIVTSQPNALIISAVGVFAVVVGIILWYRCASLLEGRFM